jgi:hypothetical protein
VSAKPPEADVAQDRHDPHEQEVAELAPRLALLDVGRELLGQVQPLEDLLAEEAVAHQVAGLDAELLALVPLGLRQLRVVVAQCQPPEHDVARLVLHDVGVQRLG